MSNSNLFINVATKKYKWDENAEDIVVLQAEIDGLANAIQNRFYKENFNNEQVLTSNGEAPDATNQINLFGNTFGICGLNLSVKSTDAGVSMKALYIIDVAFEVVGGVLNILQQNTNELYKTGTQINNLLIGIDVVGGKLQVSVNPQGTDVNATIAVKVSSA